MAISQKECLRKVSAILRHLDSDGCNGVGSLDDLINAHAYLLFLRNALQLLIHLIGNEANAHMGFNSPLREVEHGTHFKVAL